MSGFFGCISKNDCVSPVFYGTDYHSHLGTKRAGLAFFNPNDGFQRAIHSLEDGYFRTKFEGDIEKFRGNSGIGVISDTEAQPIVANSHLGKFAICTVSKIVNAEELEEEMLKNHHTFSETSQGSVNPTELIAMLIADGDDFVSGIENVFNKIKGSCSILILTEKMVIAARDKLGRTPVIIGKNGHGFAVASETCSFANLAFDIEKFLGPGEIVRITAEGYEQIRKPNNEMQVCAFLWVYYGYPPSYYEGINVEEARYRCGSALAKNDNVEADFVAGIPDSGIGHAIGYSNEAKIPYMRPYAKYTPTWPRSFMPQNQLKRDLVAKMKLIPNPAIIKGKRGIFLDDSIVRGTQLKDNTRDLHNEGIKEVHMRIACPPLTYACEFLNFSRSKKTLELATRTAISQLEGTEDVDLKKYSDPDSVEYNNMVERIRKNLGLTSLKFQKLSDLTEAIGLPKEKVCTHCWDGTTVSFAKQSQKMFDKLVIYYFTGTGNALAVSNWIAEISVIKNIQVEIKKITPSLHADIKDFTGNTLIGFCYPTHGFNAPPVVIDFMFRFPKSQNQVFLLNTRAGMKLSKLFMPGLSGLAQLFPALLLLLKGYKIAALQPMDLPSNWISIHPGLRQKVVDSIFQRCERITKRFAEKILSGKRIYRGLISLPIDLLISPVSFGYYFYGRFALTKTFVADSHCNGCALCEKECPVTAIKMKNNRPFWTRKCESCMHCMNVCPKKSIQTPHLFVAIIWWLIFAVIPMLILKELAKDFPGVSDYFNLFSDIIILITGLPVVFFTYQIVHYLMKYRFFSWLIVHTSLTKLKFWRRYSAPKKFLKAHKI